MKYVALWDIWIRIFHWGLVICVALLFFSGKTGELFFDWHKIAGELVFALIVFRLLWGFVGSSNVRISALLRHPKDAVSHLKKLSRGIVEPERGHNAAGSWAVIALLTLTAIQATTGLFAADEDELLEGPFYSLVSSDTAQVIMNIHHFNSNLLLTVILLHIVALVVYAVRGKRNLVPPMFTGRMKWPSGASAPSVSFAPWWIGLLCAVIATAVYLFVLEG